MKNILIKYLKENTDYHNVLTAVIAKSMSGKSPYKHAVENIKEDEFIQRLYDTIDIGIYESTERLQQSASYKKDVRIKNAVMNLQSMAAVNEDTAIAGKYIAFLESNIYDEVFKTELNTITESLDKNKRFMAIAHYYLSLDSERYPTAKITEAKEILYDMLVNDNESNESRFLNISESINYNKNITLAKKFFTTNKANLSYAQGDFVVENVGGIFEVIDDNNFALHTQGRRLLYNEKENIVKDLNEDTQLSNEFMGLSKLLDKGIISLTETVNIKANKYISINDETKQIFVDGKEVKIGENSLEYNLIHKYGVDKKFIPTFNYVYENLDKFVSFDTAKKIQHKDQPGLNVVIFKMNESLFAFKNNHKVAKKYITESYEPSELRNEVLSFLKFDIKKNVEIFENLFIKESQIDKKKTEILNQIEFLEKELAKIEQAETEEELEDEAVTEVKNIIKQNIADLRQEYKKVNEEIDWSDYVEVSIKGKKGKFFVEAIAYTESSKNDELVVVDEDGKKFTELKKNIKPEESI